MEDIAAIVVTSFSSNVHSEVFLQAAEKGVALVFCRNYKPVSILLPANRSTDTLLTRALVDLSPAIKQRLWKKTIDAKTINQYALATTVAPESPVLAAFKSSMEGIHPRKEAACAKHFWRIFGASAASPDFARDPMGGSLNTLLNFGYAILLALVLRHLYAVGLDPTFGIFHVPRERATPLAYDLMEPFRPCVDAKVLRWAREHPAPLDWRITKEFKAWLSPFPEDRILYNGKLLTVQHTVDRVVRSFRGAVVSGKTGVYKPWILRSLKWGGY